MELLLSDLSRAVIHGNLDLFKTSLDTMLIIDQIPSATYIAICILGSVEMVKMLLAKQAPDQSMTADNLLIPVICKNKYENSCILIMDPRVEVNKKTRVNMSVLDCLIARKKLDLIKLLLAREDIENLGLPFPLTDEIFHLLDRFRANRKKVQAELRLELGLISESASLFANVVFFCDDYLRLVTYMPDDERTRFFQILRQLPMELQMKICNTSQKKCKDLILSKESEPAFIALPLVY